MSYQRAEERQEVIPHARFVMLPSKNKRASIEAGHDVYEDKEYIEILKHGGDINTFAVNDEFKRATYDRYAQPDKAPSCCSCVTVIQYLFAHPVTGIRLLWKIGYNAPGTSE